MVEDTQPMDPHLAPLLCTHAVVLRCQFLASLQFVLDLVELSESVASPAAFGLFNDLLQVGVDLLDSGLLVEPDIVVDFVLQGLQVAILDSLLQPIDSFAHILLDLVTAFHQ